MYKERTQWSPCRRNGLLIHSGVSPGLGYRGALPTIGYQPAGWLSRLTVAQRKAEILKGSEKERTQEVLENLPDRLNVMEQEIDSIVTPHLTRNTANPTRPLKAPGQCCKPEQLTRWYHCRLLKIA